MPNKFIDKNGHPKQSRQMYGFHKNALSEKIPIRNPYCTFMNSGSEDMNCRSLPDQLMPRKSYQNKF